MLNALYVWASGKPVIASKSSCAVMYSTMDAFESGCKQSEHVLCACVMSHNNGHPILIINEKKTFAYAGQPCSTTGTH